MPKRNPKEHSKRSGSHDVSRTIAETVVPASRYDASTTHQHLPLSPESSVIRRSTRTPVDTQIIGVALALAAFAAIYVDRIANPIGRILGGAVYLLAFVATQTLYWDHIIGRIPATLRRFAKFRARAPKLFIFVPIFVWMIVDYPILLLRSALPGKSTFNEMNTEVGYLTLLGAMFLGGIIATIHVLVSIVPVEYISPAFRQFMR
jgi:hypothetical protein